MERRIAAGFMVATPMLPLNDTFRQNCRALGLLLFTAASLSGQNTGSLYGTVTDSGGGVIRATRSLTGAASGS
ncbi:MAG: hypothetical protein M3Y07_05520 [Acidobacteriota bacterium]|nr:hypothetical protein [Acidobacteriota bacterium]